ncbi:MAG: nuclear protein 96-domain-containing protein [Monoraphidium minutum]|nr:MAG: nuclear protein 96-domain-containing protein [Monoraphidium minutum]
MSRLAGGGGDGGEDGGDGNAAGGAAPQWELVCSRRQVPALVEGQLAALGRGDGQGGAAEMWQLVQVLFEHIDGDDDGEEDDGDGGDGGGGGDEAMSVGGSDADGGSPLAPASDTGAARLAAFKRRAALSGWLAGKAAAAVRDAVARARGEHGRDALLWALLHLVAGHQLGPAAALAAAAGDARLAVLLATAGRHGAISGDLGQQLQAWHSAGLWRDHYAQPRKLLYAVLSGRSGEAAAALRLDWARALGLGLW